MSFDLDAQVPAYLAAEQAEVSKQVFNYWRRKGYVKPVATDRRTGKPLYRVGDALAVDARISASPLSHRAEDRQQTAYAA